jgi:large subunit ribosomal protein L10
MAKSRKQKEEALANLNARLKESKGVVFASYTGLKVVEMEELRKELRKQNTTLDVAKKTLLKKALDEQNLKDVNLDAMDSGLAMISGPDEVYPAKITHDFAKKHEVMKFFGGIMEGKFIDVEKVKTLAALPSKDELLAKMVGSMKAPISGFANVLAGNIRGLINVLKAIKH